MFAYIHSVLLKAYSILASVPGFQKPGRDDSRVPFELVVRYMVVCASVRRESRIFFLEFDTELVLFLLLPKKITFACSFYLPGLVCTTSAVIVGGEVAIPTARGRRLRRHVCAPSMMFLKRQGSEK